MCGANMDRVAISPLSDEGGVLQLGNPVALNLDDQILQVAAGKPHLPGMCAANV